MRGYKAFNRDMTTKHDDVVHEVGATYRLPEGTELVPCESGYHFCRRVVSCFSYYDRTSSVICEIEATGRVVHDVDKSCTDEYTILRVLDESEVMDACNTGYRNTGHGNTGYRNTGDYNTGDRNTGDWNAGDCNTGYRNTGHGNTGYRNTGDCNTGDWNTGDWNAGDRNTGDCNTGDWNTGDRNSGDWNTGDRNSGDRNTGHGNAGDCNTGDWNEGNHNTGDWNRCDGSSGVLCTEEPKCLIFDRPSGMTLTEWRSTRAAGLMGRIPHDDDGRPMFLEWWDGLGVRDREVIKSIPNFDADKWLLITGIDVREGS